MFGGLVVFVVFLSFHRIAEWLRLEGTSAFDFVAYHRVLCLIWPFEFTFSIELFFCSKCLACGVLWPGVRKSSPPSVRHWEAAPACPSRGQHGGWAAPHCTEQLSRRPEVALGEPGREDASFPALHLEARHVCSWL